MNKGLRTAFAILMAIMVSGCVNSVKEGMTAVAEIPTVEAQANRVAVGMSVLRINHIIENKMPISSDANWPKLLAKEISDEQYKIIENAVQDDPYFATHHYSDAVQLQMLGGYFVPKISPLTYRALQKFVILYGEDDKNWPDIFEYSTNLDTFLEFKEADKRQPKMVEAISGDSYPNIYAALVSLMPTNYKKDLEQSRDDMLKAFEKVAELKKEREELRNILETDKAAKSKDYEGDWQPLSHQEKIEVNQQIEVLDEQIINAESDADAAQAVNYQFMDSAVEQLKSEINLSEENVRLAKNIKIAMQEIQYGSGEAGVMFTLAITNIAMRNVIENFPTELASLTASIAIMPPHKQKLMGERIRRLKENTLYLLPSIGMGSYYAVKQYRLAMKYESVVDVILEADKSLKQQHNAS